LGIVDLPAAAARVTWPRLSRTGLLFTGMLVAYGALTLAIVLKTPILGLDAGIVRLDLPHRYAQLYHPVHTYVMLGQRRPVMKLVLPLLLLMGVWQRSPRPLIGLGLAVVLLNLSVGIIKVGVGRLGPRHGDPVDALFRGGDIYPSGHVSNAVVMYGLIAMFAAPRLRPYLATVAAFLCVTIGLGTLLINTHWLTDVVGGWLAGGLVLCSLTWLVPPAERFVRRSFSMVRGVLSVAGLASGVYFGMGWLTGWMGPWVTKDFGGWLVASLFFGALPWCTPPVERLIARWWARRREPGHTAPAPSGVPLALHDDDESLVPAPSSFVA
jgi:membrane-associated phospholipid phosphatase